MDGILSRQYFPVPCGDVITVPILPESLQQQPIYQSHDLSIAAHQGYKRTLERLRQHAYCVNMAKDVLSYCRSCEKCQQVALPQRASLTNIPIGTPWHMIAVGSRVYQK